MDIKVIKIKDASELKDDDSLYISTEYDQGACFYMGHKRIAIVNLAVKETGEQIGVGFYPMLEDGRAIQNIGFNLLFDGPDKHQSIENIIHALLRVDGCSKGPAK